MLKRPTKQTRRRGAAIVEFAVCLPVLSFIILAAMETVGVIRANQGVVEVAHETARMVAATEIDFEQAHDFAITLLKRKKLRSARVTFSPQPSPDTPRGTPMIVTISVPVASNCTIISGLLAERTLSATTTVSRELGAFTQQIAWPPAKPPKRRPRQRPRGTS